MILSKFVALSACLTIPASLVSAHPLESPASLSTIPTDDQRQGSAIFNVLAPDDEAYPDPFELRFEVLKPHDDTRCGSSHFSINDHVVNTQWSQTDEKWSTSSQFALNTFHENAGWRSVEVSVDTVCLSTTSTTKREIIPGPSDTHILQATSLRIVHINGEPLRSYAGFTVTYDQSTQSIVATDTIPHSPSLWPAQSPKPQSHSSGDLQTTLHLVSQEISRLRDLEADLASFSSLVEKQRVLVGDLTRDSALSGKEALKKCGNNFVCLATTLINNAKSCAHMLYAKYGPQNARPFISANSDCVLPTTREGRIDAIVNDRPICISSPIAEDASGLPSTDGASTMHNSVVPSSRFLNTTHNIHTLLALIAAFFCLTCLTTCLHRKCCSPRAKAERAARREERRVRRQYRCLARKKAWKDWWEARLRSNTKPASTDYEEKRSMILQQEGVLEAAMQREIQELANAHGLVNDMVHAAEEGRAGSAVDVLPAYRSRAASNVTGRSVGRPPSYREVDPILNSQLERCSAFDDLAYGTDATPDSSIANLSPRQSSETLRTERSGL